MGEETTQGFGGGWEQGCGREWKHKEQSMQSMEFSKGHQ